MRYPIYIEKEKQSDYGVTVPDIPGCFSAGRTCEDALENAQEAILTHIEGLLLDNDSIPVPSTIEALREKYKEKDLIWGIVPVDLSLLSKEVKRVNITLPKNVLSKIDTFAEKEGNTRSGLLANAAIEYISQHSSK